MRDDVAAGPILRHERATGRERLLEARAERRLLAAIAIRMLLPDEGIRRDREQHLEVVRAERADRRTRRVSQKLGIRHESLQADGRARCGTITIAFPCDPSHPRGYNHDHGPSSRVPSAVEVQARHRHHARHAGVVHRRDDGDLLLGLFADVEAAARRCYKFQSWR